MDMNQPKRDGGYAGPRGRSLDLAAEILCVSKRTLIRQIRDGEIASVKISARRRIVTDAELARILSGGDAAT